MTLHIPSLHVGHGAYSSGVTVFPVWVDAPSVGSLDWKATALQIDEREGSPVVEELILTNNGRAPLVALEGDLLAGGWQDRMLAGSVLLEPRERRIVEVMCIEHGRWHGSTAHRSSGRRASARVRSSEGQHEVWNRIGRYELELGSTVSSSMLDHLDRTEPVSAPRLAGQRGVIIGIGGRIMGAELFGSTAGLRARWQGILDAAALDARLAPGIPTTSSAARRFARHLEPVSLEDAGDGGLARRLRSRSGQLRASGLGLAGSQLQIIHLSVFDESHPLLENA